MPFCLECVREGKGEEVQKGWHLPAFFRQEPLMDPWLTVLGEGIIPCVSRRHPGKAGVLAAMHGWENLRSQELGDLADHVAVGWSNTNCRPLQAPLVFLHNNKVTFLGTQEGKNRGVLGVAPQAPAPGSPRSLADRTLRLWEAVGLKMAVTQGARQIAASTVAVGFWVHFILLS